MRSILFFIAYWLITIVFALACAMLALIPGKKPLSYGLWI